MGFTWNGGGKKPPPRPKPKPSYRPTGHGPSRSDPGALCSLARTLIPVRMQPLVVRCWWAMRLPSPAPMVRLFARGT